MGATGKVDIPMLRRTLRIEHLGIYLAQSHDRRVHQDVLFEKSIS